MSSPRSKLAIIGLSASLLTALSACSTVSKVNPFSSNEPQATKSQADLIQSAPKLGVNSFLWRASLETLNFMPLDNVDPFGGVIVTEWYSNPAAPAERFKANVYILDTQLRADALKVSVFKQANNGGGWVDAAIDADTARQIENSILTRARELYIATN